MVPGAGRSSENAVGVVGCLTVGRIVAICSIGVMSQAVCRSSPVPRKCWGLEREPLWGSVWGRCPVNGRPERESAAAPLRN